MPSRTISLVSKTPFCRVLLFQSSLFSALRENVFLFPLQSRIPVFTPMTEMNLAILVKVQNLQNLLASRLLFGLKYSTGLILQLSRELESGAMSDTSSLLFFLMRPHLLGEVFFPKKVSSVFRTTGFHLSPL